MTGKRSQLEVAEMFGLLRRNLDRRVELTNEEFEHFQTFFRHRSVKKKRPTLTGNFVLAGAGLFAQNSEEVVPKLAMFPVFVVAVGATSLITRSVKANTLRILMMLEVIFFVGFAVVGWYFQPVPGIKMTEWQVINRSSRRHWNGNAEFLYESLPAKTYTHDGNDRQCHAILN